MVDVIQAPLFDYASLDSDTRSFVQEKVQSIHIRLKQIDDEATAIGLDLIAIKAKVSHGQFADLVSSEFGFTPRTAQRLMTLADNPNATLASHLGWSVRYELLNAPESVVEMVETGQITTRDEIRKEKRKALEDEGYYRISDQRRVFDAIDAGILDEDEDAQECEEETTDEQDVTFLNGTPVVIPDEWKLPAPISDIPASVQPRGTLLPDGFGLVNGKPFTMPLPYGKPIDRAEFDKIFPPLRNIDNIPIAVPHISSKNNEWYTPLDYIEAARELMGTIDLDPASCSEANETVHATRFYTKEEDGLAQDWTCTTMWLNPPYGRDPSLGSNQDIWSRRLVAEYEQGNVQEAVLLVNAAVDTKWFQSLWKFLVCFPDRRINFTTPEPSANGSTHGSALVYIGNHPQRFVEVFRRFGVVVRRVEDDGEQFS